MAVADVPNEKALFEAADEMRGSVESAEYKHLVLGLIFLSYISASFERHRAVLEASFSDPDSELYYDDPEMRAEALEDRDSYTASHVFWVPKEARWERLLEGASQDNVGEQIDLALKAIEDENPSLKDILPRIYRRAPISSQLLGRLVETIGKIKYGTTEDQARDVLGRVYEYFIKEFARAEGHRGGEFYTPANLVELLVEMLEPTHGRVYDPASGSNGMFVQSAKFIAAHGGNPEIISIYGQERNQATWRIGQMNLAIHGLSGDVQYNERGVASRGCTPEPPSRLRPGQPALQPEEVGHAVRPRRSPLALRHPARNQRQLRVDPDIRQPSSSEWQSRLRPRERFVDNDERWRRRDPRRACEGRSRGLHRRPSWAAVLHDRHPCLPVVPRSQ